jgi:hypothetical protein
MKIFNQLSLTHTILLVICIASLLTIYSYFKDHPVIKKQESKLSTKQLLTLYAIRFIHFGSMLFFCLYPFTTKITLVYDLGYLLFVFIQRIQYMILSECVLSVIEKKILDPSYITGSNIFYEPFIKVMNENYHPNKIFNILFDVISPFIVFIRVAIYVFTNYQKKSIKRNL